ncbi:glycerol-3-phosphate 1-O-acyltransferase PlsY [Pseudahrensia aquimaris]|uniref:Glycerol-3-phosphate acyltransferase n=1 Tax=Pseudahrensia aquimaris TaxID=744461 RepID=A0ABW3FPF9_9HYPH
MISAIFGIIAVPLLVGYLAGSIPFGLLIAKFGGAGDVRAIGSGNIGATNVLRTGKKGLAAATLICDALKGTLPVLFFLPNGEAALAAGFGAFVGHLFPIWLKFKGGKGIATFVGVAAAFWWQGIAAFAAVWLIVAATTRYSSLAAILATLATTLAFWFAGRLEIAFAFSLMTTLAWLKHIPNVQRLLNGTESKIGTKSKDKP